LTTWSYDRDTGISLQAIVEKSVSSFRREKEAYKAMSTHNHDGKIWSNVDAPGANRRKGPGKDFALIDTLPAGTSFIVLCYALGNAEVKWTGPDGTMYNSNAWDFVVTGNQDGGGYVADVLIDTGGKITDQLGAQGSCHALGQHLVQTSQTSSSTGTGEG